MNTNLLCEPRIGSFCALQVWIVGQHEGFTHRLDTPPRDGTAASADVPPLE